MHDQGASVGEQLRSFRLRAGLSQESLAERAGLATSAVAALEQGTRRSPYPHTLRALAEALGLSGDERTAFVMAARRPARHSDSPPGATAAVARRTAPPQNFRLPLTAWIGRAQEAAQLRAQVSGTAGRLVTLTGVGGVGKTSLALRVAAEMRGAFPDGVWLVELAPLADPGLVARATAAALGLPDVARGSPLDALVAFLAPKSLLLVLDNCEHVLDACAELVEQLLGSCPEVRILATSREALDVAGEQRLRLRPLATPQPDEVGGIGELTHYAAIQLFVERAHLASPDFQLTPSNAPVVAQVCARVDGIPLALELAAARVRVLSVEQIAQRLDDALRLLTGGSRAAPTRQQTLTGTLDWSRALLSQPEQAVFRRLAIFAGSCDLEAAEAVCTGADVAEGDVLDLLARLLDKSLLIVEQSAATSRYRLLEPVRQYAYRQLVQADEVASTRDRHAAHYLCLAERAAPELRGPHQVDWQQRLDLERDNLRAALRWTQAAHEIETMCRLAVALTPFWERGGYLGEGHLWLSAALAAQPCTSQPTPLAAAVLVASGQLAHWQADLDAAAAYLERSLTLSIELNDARGVAESISWLGSVRRRQAAYAEAVRLLEDGLARHRALGDDWGAAFALLGIGVASGALNEPARARAALHESLRLFQAVADPRYVAMVRAMLGSFLAQQQEPEHAFELLARALVGHREVGDRAFIPYSLMNLAAAAAVRGQLVQAARWLGASEAQREVQGASLAPVSVRTIERIMRRVRDCLSEAECADAWSAGRRLTLDQIMADLERSVAAGHRPAPRPPAPATTGSLTRREREVADLLAEGKTDRQLADALGISIRTASVHVHRVLTKLGLRSRWQVAEVLHKAR